jgi:hypothetical protein
LSSPILTGEAERHREAQLVRFVVLDGLQLVARQRVAVHVATLDVDELLDGVSLVRVSVAE